MQGIENRTVGLITQRFQITTGKTRARVRGVDRFGADLSHTHTVSRARHRQLGINGVTFTIGILFIKQWRCDSVSQTVDRSFQRIIFDFKIKRSAVWRGAGIVAAAVHFEEFGKAIRLWVFFGAHQRHVFEIMGKSRV
ncbi:hypothetical protein D3C86_1696320 [compost metagenome]